MKIKVELTPNTTTNTITVTLEDLGLTQEQWDEMDEGQKEETLNNHLFDLPEQPYWMVDKFKEKE
jgi:hypothetical protein